ncbi:unnamed protein product [Discula destructiva]
MAPFNADHTERADASESEWVFVDGALTEARTSSDEAAFTPVHESPPCSLLPATPTTPPPRKEGCDGLTDIEDSGAAKKDGGKCLNCSGCKSKSPPKSPSR